MLFDKVTNYDVSRALRGASTIERVRAVYRGCCDSWLTSHPVMKRARSCSKKSEGSASRRWLYSSHSWCESRAHDIGRGRDLTSIPSVTGTSRRNYCYTRRKNRMSLRHRPSRIARNPRVRFRLYIRPHVSPRRVSIASTSSIARRNQDTCSTPACGWG